MNTHTYRKISIIIYNNKRFQVFMDERNRYAFLELDENNKFHYPKIEDFIGLANIFSEDLDSKAYYRRAIKRKNRFVFTASVLAATSIIAASHFLFNELEQQGQLDNTQVTQVISVSDDYEKDNELVEHTPVTYKNEEFTTTTAPTIVSSTIDNEEYTVPVYDGYIPNYTPKTYTTVTDDMYREFETEIDIYHSYALNKFLGEKHITLEDIKEVVNQNDSIKPEIKNEIIRLADAMIKTYPGIDMRLFYENVKRVQIVYETDESIAEHGDMAAWFDPKDITIHINENIDLTRGSEDEMILMHEGGHMASLGIIEADNGKTIVAITNDNAYGMGLREAIDVILTSTPFKDEYAFDDFGYPLYTNELEAIIEVIPNFDFTVLVNQDVYNIAAYLDQINPTSIPASRAIELMDMQNISYYNTAVKSEKDQYDDIYRYIGETYYNYVLTPDMSYEEIQEISYNLKEKLNDNVGYTDLTEYDEIDKIFDQYMIDNNIIQNTKTK